MSDDIDVYLGFACHAILLLYMLLLYVQTRGKPESLTLRVSYERRVARSTRGE